MDDQEPGQFQDVGIDAEETLGDPTVAAVMFVEDGGEGGRVDGGVI